MNGWHCALMCGGVASMMEKPTLNSISFVKPSQLFHQQVIMHLGRITTYSILGAIAAAIGVRVWQQNIVSIQRPLFLFTSLFLIYIGFQLLRKRQNSSDFLNKKLGSKLAILWSKYLGSLGSSPILTGFLIMLAFGLGTLPNLLMISKFSGFLAQVGRYPWVKYLAALLFITSGIVGIYRTWTLPYSLLKEGFCFS